MDLKKRLKYFISEKNLRLSFFESKIGLSHGYVNSITKNIGNDKLERIVEHYPELNIEWLLLGKGEMLKKPTLNSVVNESETPYTNTTAKFEEAREKIITLQEKLIEAVQNLLKDKDELMNKEKELIECKNDFIASQKMILELTNQNHSLQEKYNSLKESILSKNIYNIFTNSEFFKEAKKKFNHVPIDLVFMFMYGSLIL